MENKEMVLVTGGNGFLAMHIILQLLKRNFKVRASLRSLKSKEKVLETLKANGINSFENLSFVESELLSDQNWKEAMQDCKYVLSVASPVFLDKPKDETEAIRPAVEGIQRILRFAKDANVKRVVMTSNFGAVGFSQTDKSRDTTEADWTDTNINGLSVYEKSKTLAEKAAWEFIKRDGNGLEFATINPVAILGPSLNEHVTGSFNILLHMLDGSMKAIPNIPLNIVDVRDVADLHIKAMENASANGQRFIATADGQISMQEIAELIRNSKPMFASNVSTRKIPNLVLKLASLFNEKAKEGYLLLRMNRKVSNKKAKNMLGWKPMSTQEDAILASLESIIKFNLIKS
ncbi:SDR family oxidoreductase [Emticicia sp. SJ17W-69]|uniref:SDR family oxidoreductase n=1 Tax=Emticicia sp. SJ17W-69 TaxID=3421657 RepID=UPI003EBD249A